MTKQTRLLQQGSYHRQRKPRNKKRKTGKRKRKSRNIARQFIEKCTIVEVWVGAANQKSLKGSSDTTPALQSIKGACPN
jgi:hypothetical protein